MKFPPIAIIGQGCILPQAFSSQALWQLVKNKQVVLRSVPDKRWRIPLNNILRSKEEWKANYAYSDVGGYVSRFDEYLLETRLVGQYPLTGLDNVFRWTLAASWQALTMSAYLNRKKQLVNSGLILGNLSYPCTELSRLFDKSSLADLQQGDNYLNRFMSGAPALHTAKLLGLGKDSFCLDAACASSLYALKLACERLHDHRADMMLAGGVCAADSLLVPDR